MAPRTEPIDAKKPIVPRKTASIRVRYYGPPPALYTGRAICRRRGCYDDANWRARYYDATGRLLQTYWWCDEDVPEHIRAKRVEQRRGG